MIPHRINHIVVAPSLVDSLSPPALSLFDSLHWSLFRDDPKWFLIRSTFLFPFPCSLLPPSGKQVYRMTVVVRDQKGGVARGGEAQHTFSVAVLDANDAPVLPAAQVLRLE